MSKCCRSFSFRVALFLSLMSLVSIAHSECVISANQATCSGTFIPGELPLIFTFDGDGVDTLVIDATVDAEGTDTSTFRLLNNDTSATANLELVVEAGAVIDRNGTADPDSLFIINRGSGTTTARIAGTLASTSRAVRLWSNLATNTGANLIEVDPGAVVDNSNGPGGATGLWIRNQNLGPSTVNVSGQVVVGTIGQPASFRGVHLSQNNDLSIEDAVVRVTDTGTLFSNQQGLYIGDAGSGQARFEVAGPVRVGGANDLVSSDVMTAIFVEAESGGSLVDVQIGGELNALNDSAIFDADTLNTDVDADIMVMNDGLITGYVLLGGGDDTFVNQSDNSFNIRNFRDDDADGVRETENIAVSDFGADDDLFDQTAGGTLRLLSIPDSSGASAGTDDDTAPSAFNQPSPLTFNQTTASEYFPPGSAALSNTIDGVEQAHFINLETFSHNGVVTMQDVETGAGLAVPGDVFVVTGGDTAGVENGGEYVANGGTLRLDVLLDDGAVDTADVLVVDSAVLGNGGPVQLQITNAGGAGALTGTEPTDGILVIQVLGDSDPDAFELVAGFVRAGDFIYRLVQADGQNWYLQSEPAPQTVPVMNSWSVLVLMIMMLLVAAGMHGRFRRPESV